MINMKNPSHETDSEPKWLRLSFGTFFLIFSLRPLIAGRATFRGFHVEGFGAHVLGAFIFIFGGMMIFQAVRKKRDA